MSTYYDFMVEAKYEGKWYNIDFHTKDIDGKLRHQYLATISRSFIGLLEDRVNGAWAISFDGPGHLSFGLPLHRHAGSQLRLCGR